jgi:hypothetical protein
MINPCECSVSNESLKIKRKKFSFLSTREEATHRAVDATRTSIVSSAFEGSVEPFKTTIDDCRGANELEPFDGIEDTFEQVEEEGRSEGSDNIESDCTSEGSVDDLSDEEKPSGMVDVNGEYDESGVSFWTYVDGGKVPVSREGNSSSAEKEIYKSKN